MGFLGKLASGITKFGNIAGAVLRPLGSIAPKAASVVSGLANTFLPPTAAKVVSGVANKVGEFIGSGRAADLAGGIAGAGMKLANLAMNPGGYGS